ncbi:putative aldo/keto reductase-like oxidoreductase [Clostridium pascui]|uniref:aldo/keto reductase n=1 Tax=Clostridium pascui TaxID=46609 RepID=UPI00195C90BE|nr:aldo/keto reductase [Clostridium pascui]MBM7871075.1 putative aldo/keto reductase-like oxidoreductase [Clostridium pascui]
MLYRRFGREDFIVSSLGFGCMRFPIINNSDELIDEEKAIEMLRYAIDNGVNYVDTAYPYHKGQSEILVGKALKDGYRERVKLATKSPVWLTESYEDFYKYLNEQLEKLQTNYIDMYLLHALNKERWEAILKLDVLKFLDKAKEKGLIKHPGFSFHGDLDTFKQIVDSYDWSFCQIQYNILDVDYQAGVEGLKYASSKGLAVIIMEPLKGGKLAVTPPDEIQSLWNKSKIKRPNVHWALKWLWNQPEVTLILSGMSSLEQVMDNISYAEDSETGSLTNQELKIVDEVRNTYNNLIKINCTKCGYCMPCPQGVDIPLNFSIYNDRHIYNDLKSSLKKYKDLHENKKASSCIECGKCQPLCPQNLPIIDTLKKLHGELSPN